MILPLSSAELTLSLGVSHAARRLQSGQRIRLDGNTGQIQLLKETPHE